MCGHHHCDMLYRIVSIVCMHVAPPFLPRADMDVWGPRLTVWGGEGEGLEGTSLFSDASCVPSRYVQYVLQTSLQHRCFFQTMTAVLTVYVFWQSHAHVTCLSLRRITVVRFLCWCPVCRVHGVYSPWALACVCGSVATV